LVRYYGVYSNVSRGKKKKLTGVETVTWKAEVTEVPPPLVSKELKGRWSYSIRKVYETDPLVCPKCSGERVREKPTNKMARSLRALELKLKNQET